MNQLLLIRRSLAGRPARSLLTALGVAIGTSAFVALVSLAESFSATMNAMFASRRTDISVVRADSPDVLMSSLPQELWPEIESVSGVAAVAPVLAEMLWAEEQPASLVMGMAAGSYLLDHFRILQGRSLEAADLDEAIIGQTLARRLDKGLGDPYEVESRRFRVVGIYDAGNNLENAGAVLPLARLQWLLNREGEVTAFNVRVAEDVSHATTAAELERRFKNLRAVLTSQLNSANSGIGLAKAMAWGTSLIALAIGLIGTLNSMLMTVLERTREIGVLRALGWRRRRICSLILGESLALSAIGGATGLLLGAGALRLLLEHHSIRGVLTAGLSPALALEALALALCLGLLGGLLPALRAANLPPTEALRHE